MFVDCHDNQAVDDLAVLDEYVNGFERLPDTRNDKALEGLGVILSMWCSFCPSRG